MEENRRYGRERLLKIVEGIYVPQVEDLKQRLSGLISKTEKNKKALVEYINHLEKVYDLIKQEDNPLTVKLLKFNIQTDFPYSIIHQGIYDIYRENPLVSQETLFEEYFGLEDIEKLRDIRSNSPLKIQELFADERKFCAAILGFVEASPEELHNLSQKVIAAKKNIEKYQTLGLIERIKKRKQYEHDKEFLGEDNCLIFPFRLTPLGKNAIFPIAREAVNLAEEAGLFKDFELRISY